jgi:hypothetical protein
MFPLGLELLSQGYVQFSVGLGILISIVFQFIMGFVDMALHMVNREEMEPGGAAVLIIGKMIFEFALSVQQYMVLFPLQNVLPTPYCLIINVPHDVEIEYAVCLFKISTAGIPIGLPCLVGGGFIGFAGLGMGGWAGIIIGLIGLFFFGFGLSLLIFWLFGGFVLGSWYMFTGGTYGFSPSTTALIIVGMKCTSLGLALLDKVCCCCCRPGLEQAREFIAIEMVNRERENQM